MAQGNNQELALTGLPPTHGLQPPEQQQAAPAAGYLAATGPARQRALRQLSVVLNALARVPCLEGVDAKGGQAVSTALAPRMHSPTDARPATAQPSADGLALLVDLVCDPLVAAQLLYTGLDERLASLTHEVRAAVHFL